VKKGRETKLSPFLLSVMKKINKKEDFKRILRDIRINY